MNSNQQQHLVTSQLLGTKCSVLCNRPYCSVHQIYSLSCLFAAAVHFKRCHQLLYKAVVVGYARELWVAVCNRKLAS